MNIELRISVDKIISAALAEDSAFRDATSALMPRRIRLKAVVAVMKAGESGVICGLDVAERVFRAVSRQNRVKIFVPDGKRVSRGDSLLEVKGPLGAILSAERTALNFVGRLSGIATLSAAFASKARGTRARIFDTRKTTPGLRALEKYAVKTGGGFNHRMSLSDMALVKDNHLAAMSDPEKWVRAARARYGRGGKKIEIECDSLSRIMAVCEAAPDAILLDNMSPSELREAIRTVRKIAPSMVIEVSGGVKLGDVRRISRLCPDRISVGALTHSAKSLDVSLEIPQ
ncbi:MAG: carboxylating nicotinate-nucleotide diphosphorylase [Endomicrobiia bacterium]|nr:carboxylating nicotinate-nucleotide diphosphorylase [Endomicrobiia bacterium]